ncbi:hypothetical protein Q7P36_009509 [Cladosporium allicinum]
MAPLASNLTRPNFPHSFPYSNSTTSNNDTLSTSTAIFSSSPVSDTTWTFIFGIVATVLAVVTIIIACLQLRKKYNKNSKTSPSPAAPDIPLPDLPAPDLPPPDLPPPEVPARLPASPPPPPPPANEQV